LLTGSRGGFISLLAEIAILAWIVIWRNPRPGRGMRVATTGLVLVAGASLFFWLVPGYVLSKIGTVKNYVPEARQGSRPILWKNSLGIFRDHPVAGTGLGSFVSVFPEHQTEAVDLTIEHAHNDYVEVLTETGVLGGVLVLATMLLFFRITFRNLALQLKYEPGWIQLGGTIACCGLAVHSFVDFNLHIPANAAWFAFCAGIASLSGRFVAKQAK
jgi:O-antigen ligase